MWYDIVLPIIGAIFLLLVLAVTVAPYILIKYYDYKREKERGK